MKGWLLTTLLVLIVGVPACSQFYWPESAVRLFPVPTIRGAR